MARLGIRLWIMCATAMIGVVAIGRFLPRGGELAFVSVRDGNYEIYLLDANHALQYNLSRHRSRDDTPVWSPDGRHLAFVSYRGGDAQIYIADTDTGKLRALTDAAASSLNPSWSPDGKQIAFVSSRSERWTLYLADPTCEADCESLISELPVTMPQRQGVMGKPDWSPDGRYLALALNLPSGSAAVHIIDVVNGESRALNSELIDPRLSWSSDGRFIAYTSISDRTLEVYTLDLVDGSPRNLSQYLGYDGVPSWSPDGQTLAFESSREGKVEIYRMNRDGTDLERLTDDGPNMRPSWSPDGTEIAFESPTGGSYDIYILDVASRNIHRLTTDSADDRFAAWRPG